MTSKIENHKKIRIRDIAFLQFIIVIYSLSGVMAKFASGNDFLSIKFVIFYGFEILILGIYAILWQQVIKRVQLSVAYANRAMAILWSMLWATAFFNEQITIKNIIGIIIVVIGTVIVNGETAEDKI